MPDVLSAVESEVEHTWSEAGPLGLELVQLGETEDAPGGVKVISAKEDIPTKLVGLSIETIAGEHICLSFYISLS